MLVVVVVVESMVDVVADVDVAEVEYGSSVGDVVVDSIIVETVDDEDDVEDTADGTPGAVVARTG